jgi:hypothetical protein
LLHLLSQEFDRQFAELTRLRTQLGYSSEGADDSLKLEEPISPIIMIHGTNPAGHSALRQHGRDQALPGKIEELDIVQTSSTAPISLAWTEESPPANGKAQWMQQSSPTNEKLPQQPSSSPEEMEVTEKRTLSKTLIGQTALQRDPWTINPEQSNNLAYWDQVTILALCFVAVVTPVEVAMMEAQFDAMFVINRLVDLIFLCDMILQFFLMYPVKTSSGYMMEFRHKRIIAHYLRGWFIIDFLSVQQFDLIGVLMQSEALNRMKVIKIIRLLRLLKLIKVSKAGRVFRRLEIRLAISYQRVALYKFILFLFTVSHWLACLWALGLLLGANSGPQWIDGFDDLEVDFKETTRENLWMKYIASLYFTSYTITSVGYGDIGPKKFDRKDHLHFHDLHCGHSLGLCAWSGLRHHGQHGPI